MEIYKYYISVVRLSQLQYTENPANNQRFRAHISLTSPEPHFRVLGVKRTEYQKTYFEANLSLLRVHIFTP